MYVDGGFELNNFINLKFKYIILWVLDRLWSGVLLRNSNLNKNWYIKGD